MPKQETAEMLKGGPAEVSAFGLDKDPVVQQAANPDTAGATLATLEAEVNELKAVLRAFGFIAT